MTSGEFSSSVGTDALMPASAARGPEQNPPGGEAERKARRRPSPPKENSEDSLTPADDTPAHQLDDLA